MKKEVKDALNDEELRDIIDYVMKRFKYDYAEMDFCVNLSHLLDSMSFFMLKVVAKHMNNQTLNIFHEHYEKKRKNNEIFES